MPGKMCSGFGSRSAALPKESRAFCEGQLARSVGKAIGDNPHAGGNAKDSWDWGFFLIDQQAPTDNPAVGDCCAAIVSVGGVPADIYPRWVDAIPAVSEPTSDTWDIDLNNYIAFGTTPITYTIDTGALPSGITLDPSGTFLGVTENVGAGSVTFIASNAGGDSARSPTIDWNTTS
ncbi:MAG: hypothetical protein DRP85_03325 [Candidatus Makaraimicrobium thalassicum]|nr:MAG: hypothetical protein DRP85_03325 [Candidatus Omnitrophota bacterium]